MPFDLPPISFSELRIASAPPNQLVEYCELRGPAGIDIQSLGAGQPVHLVVIGDAEPQEFIMLNGNAGVIEAAIPLAGSFNAAGFYVVATEAAERFFPGQQQYSPGPFFEEVDNLTLLVVTGINAVPTEDLDWDDDGVLDIEPWTAVLDGLSVVLSLDMSEPVYWPGRTLGPTGGWAVPQASRCPDTGEWRIGELALFVNDTPGACPGVCGGTICPGDLDSDSAIGASDLALLLGAWGATGPGDFDGDCTVGAADIALLLGHWGDTCP